MKIKTILFLAISGAFLVSCTKNYTCNCHSTVGKSDYYEYATFIKKSEAKTWCEGSNSAEGSNITCTLEVTKLKKKKEDKKD
jgi:hypothetical protein